MPLTDDGRNLRYLVALYAALTAVPQLVKRLIEGRLYAVQALENSTSNPLVVTALGALLAAAIISASLVLLYQRAERVVLRPPPLTVALLAILAPIAVFHHFAGVSWQAVVVNVVLFAALSTLRPTLDDLRVFAHIGTVIAVGSMLFGALSADAYRAGTLEDAHTKAFLGTGVLAGPYPSSNNLGMGMALAIPFAFLIRNRSLRAFELAAMLVALVMSSSRSALIAAGVALVATGVVKLLRRETERAVFYWFGIIIAALCSVVLPWLVNSSSTFTGRGGIWVASRGLIETNPLTGYGETAYGANGLVQIMTGSPAAAGHNLLLHYWVVGGLPGLLAMAVILAGVMRAGRWGQGHSLAPTAFAFVFVVLTIDEMPLNVELVVGQAWVAVPAIAVLLAASRRTSGEQAAVTRDGAEPLSRAG